MTERDEQLQVLNETIEAARELAEALDVPIPVAWTQDEYRAVMDAMKLGVGTGALDDRTEVKARKALQRIGVDETALDMIFGEEFE